MASGPPGALARQSRGCLQIGSPPLLDEAEMQTVLVKMAGYGHQARTKIETGGDDDA